MKTLALILGVSWIVFTTTLAITSVGEIPICNGKPYEWSLVVTIFGSVALPLVMGLIMGLIAGRLDE